MIRSLRSAGRRRSPHALQVLLGTTRPSCGPCMSSAACQRLPLAKIPADLTFSYGSIGRHGISTAIRHQNPQSRRRVYRGEGLFTGWRCQSVQPFATKSTRTRDAKEEGEPSNVDSSQKDDTSTDIYSHWWGQITSPPNLITLTRIASAPVLSYFIVSNQHDMALVGCLVAGMSDALDGYLAKSHNMSTVLGTYLDPLADKVLINVLSASLWYVGTLPGPLVALWFAKDAALTIGAYQYVAKNTSVGRAVMDPFTTPLKVNPTFTSKVNTALQFATLSLAIVVPMYPDMVPTLTVLCWGTGLTTVGSGFSYLGYSAFSSSGNVVPSRGSRPDDANPPPKP